jgi:hypothetical protein
VCTIHACSNLVLVIVQAKDANQLTGDFQGKPGWDINDANFYNES